MLKMKKNYLLLLLASSTIFIDAQEAKTDIISEKPEHQIGLAISTTTGIGISYRISYKKSQFQLVSLPLINKDFQSLTLGIAYKYKIRDNKKWDIYTYAGGFFFSPDLAHSTLVNAASLGLSFDYSPIDLFTFNFETGYGIYALGQDDWITNVSIGAGVGFNISKLYTK